LCGRSALTIIDGSSLPSMPASALRAVEIAVRIAASWLMPAVCALLAVSRQRMEVARRPIGLASAVAEGRHGRPAAA
jgi:hypothetical protein